MVSKIIKTVEASNIPIEDLTEVVLDGNGVFDKFLSLHRLVLDREFKQARIVGKEYSDAFTQTYIANMELAIRFLMEKEKQAYEIELLEAQLCNLEKDCETKQYNLDHILPKELELKDAQMRKMDVDARIAEKDLELKEAMFPLTVSLAEKQIEKLTADTAIALKRLELDEAMLPLTINLTTAQIKKMEADALIAEKQVELADKELILKEKQLDYQDKQLELLTEQLVLQKQKIKTERAQTESDVAEPGSIIATNVDTLKSQMLGIERDAKQKVLQLMLSTWTTRKNNDAAEENYQNLLTDDVIGAVIQDALGSIGYNIDVPAGEAGPRPTTPTEPNYVIP